MRQKLAIVGTHPATREDAPWDDPDYDIWVFNEAAQADWVKRWDACLQMHKPEIYASENNWVRADHWSWLQQDHGQRVIWMQDHDNRIPNSAAYPIDLIVARFGISEFSSSPAYALALAVYMGYKMIDLYGVEMQSNSEYGHQLPNFKLWVGVALGAGCKIGRFCGAVLNGSTRYGYDGEIQIPRERFAERVEKMAAEFDTSEKKLQRAKNKLDTAIIERKYDKIPALLSEFTDLSTETGYCAGALSEAQRYLSKTDPISRQEYERRGATARGEGEAARDAMHHAAGKLEYVFNVWRQTGADEALRQMRQFIGDSAKLAYDAGARKGAHDENMGYTLVYDDLVTAAGGQRTLAALEGK